MKIKTLLAALLITSSVVAENINTNKLDSLFNLIEENDKGMGAVSLFHDGKEIYQKSYGYADVATKQKNNADTKFRIGSISKTFTATIIMRLIESGKLSLSTTLDNFYPQIINSNIITVHHLLQHRSGIPNFTNQTYTLWYTQKHTKEQLLVRIDANDNMFEPDEKFEYSNSNYVLLTWIAEDVSGKKYSELLSEMILKPCNLKNTYIGSKINTKNNEALSYIKLLDWNLSPETDMSIPLGAGSIVSTPTDLNKFLHCLFNGKLVSNKSLEQMKILKDNSGLGLFQVPFYEKTSYGHGGDIDGFHSVASYFADDNVSVALTSNALDYPLNDIVVAVLSVYYGKEYKLPVFKKITQSEEELTRYEGVYSAPGFPLKLSVKRNKDILIAQGTGQPSFPLEYVEKHTYKFNPGGLEIEFLPEKGELILRQSGGIYNLKKE